MTKALTEGWAIKMTVKKTGQSWWRYNSYGSPWKRRTEPANYVSRSRGQDGPHRVELYKVHMFYEPDPE